MRIKIILLLIVSVLLTMNVAAQKQDASAVVKDFYRFHLSHEDTFNKIEITRRSRFFTPKLRQFFDAELNRQKIHSKKYPNDKPYFEGLPFNPIEFCPKDYRVGKTQTTRQAATVTVNLVYSKSSCDANDGTKIPYKILLKKIAGKWLIDDVVYDDGSTLTTDFSEARKIK